ncbi:MAG: hypothetical protein JNL90_10400 [Planctomycetes bacterium]|nr:hypothetical protein [Planctomycetota bacterium]
MIAPLLAGCAAFATLAASADEPLVSIAAPQSAPPARVAALTAAAARGATAAAAFLAVELPSGDAIELTWAANHEEFGLAHGTSLELLDDPAIGPVAFTFGSGGLVESGSAYPADEARALRRATQAGALAALRSLAGDVAPERRAALAEELAAPGFAAAARARFAALLRTGFVPPDATELAAPRTSPELRRLIAGAELAELLAPEDARPLATPPDPLRRASDWRRAPTAADRAALLERLRAAQSSPAAAHAPPPANLRGFCFAHEGYGWVDGYGSRAAARSLEAARAVGANAVSITPFAFQRDVAAPALQLLHERRAGRFAPESDGAVAATIADAQELGFTVLLKPHLWCGHGRWCGEIAMRDEAAWTQWFAEFERFVLHYALLAERLAVPVLVVATELPGTTPREAQWRTLLARVRAVYGGIVTYAANWGEELERVAFWDALDVVGVSAYWPLADGPGAAIEGVAARFDALQGRLAQQRRALGKPLWFLEIGFPDVREPWRTPHAHDGEFDGGADQGRAYSLVLDAVARRGIPDALFWWKWPSDLRALDPSKHHDFWPCGRAAEAALRAAWRGDALRPAGNGDGERR